MEPIPLADIPPANPDAREDVQPITSASTTGEELPQPKTPFDKGGAEAKDTCDLDKKSAGGGIGKNFTPVNKGGAEVEKDTCDIDKSAGGIGKNLTCVNKGGAEEKDTCDIDKSGGDRSEIFTDSPTRLVDIAWILLNLCTPLLTGVRFLPIPPTKAVQRRRNAISTSLVGESVKISLLSTRAVQRRRIPLMLLQRKGSWFRNPGCR